MKRANFSDLFASNYIAREFFILYRCVFRIKFITEVNGNKTDIRIEDAKLGPLISTRGLRFIVTELDDTSKYFDFTVKVYGCTAPWDPFIFDVCTKTFVEKKPERNLMKSFLSTKELLIHCGLSPVIYRKETYTKRCFLTTSRMPFKWTDFGPRISEIALLLKPSNTIVGQSDNISAFISEDMGFTWKVINQFLMKQMMSRSSEIIYSTNMTQYYARKTHGEDFINTMCEGNNNDDWKICANGIAYGSKLITDWSSHNFTLPLHI
uniref:Sortilin_C domain-containing protein n=1 Tax=Trichobilharzia regenti TaxID=157069 RepID=A0AA85KEB7_TRIRE|nr:unnamed protein product [Trichobilharzia regenti]